MSHTLPLTESPPVDSPPSRTLTAAMLGLFVVTLDAVVVNVALPTIGRELSAGLTGLQWVVDGYTLMFAVLLLGAGALTDRIGARRTYGWGVLAFVGASMVCGLAPGLSVLVAARFVQGAAAAVMMPSSMALIGQAYPDPVRRGRAVSWWAMGGAIATSAGPVLGGALLTAVGWRWIFWINLPVGLVALLLLRHTLPSAQRVSSFDWVGQLLAVLTMGAITYGAIEAGVSGPTHPTVLAAFAIAMIAGAGFLVSQRRVTHPMLPPEVVRIPDARIGAAVGFAFMACYFGLPFVMSLYLQQHRGLSALDTGTHFLPMMLVGLLLTPFSSRLAERFGARTLVVAGLAFMVGGLAALAIVAPEVHTAWISALMLLVGMGGPLISPPITAVLLASAPPALAGTVSGLYNTSRQVGGALSVAVFGALLNRSASFEAGMRTSLLIAAEVALLTTLAALRLGAAAVARERGRRKRR